MNKNKAAERKGRVLFINARIETAMDLGREIPKPKGRLIYA